MTDAELCELIERRLLTKEQRAFLAAEHSPRWDLNPPQRESFTNAEAYVKDLRRYVTEAMAHLPQKPKPVVSYDMDDWWGFGG